MTDAITERQRIAVPTHLVPYLGYLPVAHGEFLPDQPNMRWITLPAGWTATHRGSDEWLRDEHGRRRIVINYRPPFDDQPTIKVLDPDSHAWGVAEHGDTLIIDAWATPGSMLGSVGERIDTFHRLLYVNGHDLARWAKEQPEHAARLRQERAGYERKLAAYTGLLGRLVEAMTSGWTPPWTDRDLVSGEAVTS